MNRPNKCYKTIDGDIWASRSVAVVGGVVLKHKFGNFVLITRRAEHMLDMPNRWCLPCGYLDWDENIHDATIREIFEETRLDLNKAYNLHVYPNIRVYSEPKENRQNVSITTAFIIESNEFPDIETTDETNDVAWCHIDSIPSMDLVFGHLDIVNLIKESCVNG